MSNSVTGFINGSVAQNTYSGSGGSSAAIQKQIDALEARLSADKEMSTEEKQQVKKQIGELQKELTSSQMATASSTAQSEVASVFGSLSSSPDGTNDLGGLSSLLSAASTGEYVKAINSARVTIENKSRTLTSEIAMDKKRGVDTSAKEETLSNLTENLTILDDSLAKKVENALKNEDTSAEKKAAEKSSDDKKTSEKEADKTESSTASSADGTKKTDAVTGDAEAEK